MMEFDDIVTQDLSDGEEETTDPRKHNQLLDAISSLDGKTKHRASQRTVLTNQISEFNFTNSKGSGSKVNLHELVGTLKDSTSHGELKKKLSSIDKHGDLVSVPIPQHEKQKIDRVVAYETQSKELSKWDPVVRSNRQADQQQFPLQKQDFKLITTDQFVKRFTPRTPLEMEVAAMLHGSDNVIKNVKQELTPAEQRALRAMDINEAKERRLELMKHRALMSYQETKFKRQKKIKSKKYHRVLKKEREKKEKKEIEEMKQKDPEGYLDQIKLIDKDRAQERITLRHRGGSKFGKRQTMYAKYDDKARQEVQDMLQKSRELTKKVDVESESDEEIEDDITGIESQEAIDMLNNDIISGKGSNPWMKANSSKVRPNVVTDNDDEWETTLVDDSEEGEDDVEKVEHDVVIFDDDKIKDMKIKNTNELHEKATDTVVVNKANGKADADIDEIFNSKTTTDVGTYKLKKRQRNRKQKTESINKTNPVQSNKENKSKKENKAKKGKKEKLKKAENVETIVDSSDNNETEEIDDDGDEIISESLSRKRTLEELEELQEEPTQSKPISAPKKQKIKDNKKKEKKPTPKEAFVDPNKFLTLESNIKQVGTGPNIVDDDNEEMDADEQQRSIIAQAFADDDVIDEFRRDKDAVLDKQTPKDVDLTLPGWGDWGGTGIKPSKRKRRRIVVKAVKQAPRQDVHLGHVILNEDKNKAITKHQVSQIPFPYKNMEQFEKSIRAPIGKTWNTETAYKQLIKPKVVTHIGQIIEPMEKAHVFKNQKVSGADTITKSGGKGSGAKGFGQKGASKDSDGTKVRVRNRKSGLKKQNKAHNSKGKGPGARKSK